MTGSWPHGTGGLQTHSTTQPRVARSCPLCLKPPAQSTPKYHGGLSPSPAARYPHSAALSAPPTHHSRQDRDARASPYSLHNPPAPAFVLTGVVAVGAIVEERVHGGFLGRRDHGRLINGGLQQLHGFRGTFPKSPMEFHAEVLLSIPSARGTPRCLSGGRGVLALKQVGQ